MQKFALTAEISTKVTGGATFCVHPVHAYRQTDRQTDIDQNYYHAASRVVKRGVVAERYWRCVGLYQ